MGINYIFIVVIGERNLNHSQKDLTENKNIIDFFKCYGKFSCFQRS